MVVTYVRTLGDVRHRWQEPVPSFHRRNTAATRRTRPLPSVAGVGTTASTPETTDDFWVPVCPFVRLPVDRGVTALVHGTAVAVFRTDDEQVFVLGNHDPLTHTGTLAKGIVGTRDGVPFVASPVHRKAFDLRTGQCLEDPHVAVPSYPVRVVDGTVQVGRRS